MHTLFHRLINSPLSPDNNKKELNIIKKIAFNNNFPLDILNNLHNKQIVKFYNNQLIKKNSMYIFL